MKSHIYQVMVQEGPGLTLPLHLTIYIKRVPDEDDKTGWAGTEEIRAFLCDSWEIVAQQIKAAAHDLNKWD